MITNKIRSVRTLSICLLTGLLLVSCAELRLLTYPVDFTWIGKEHLKTVMHEMANSVSKINSTLDNGISSTVQQDNIVDELDNLESLASSLSGETEWSISDRSHAKTNHTLLTDNLDRFIELVSIARLQAQATPANYYGVGKITGGCLSCHNLK